MTDQLTMTEPGWYAIVTDPLPQGVPVPDRGPYRTPEEVQAAILRYQARADGRYSLWDSLPLLLGPYPTREAARRAKKDDPVPHQLPFSTRQGDTMPPKAPGWKTVDSFLDDLWDLIDRHPYWSLERLARHVGRPVDEIEKWRRGEDLPDYFTMYILTGIYARERVYARRDGIFTI